MARFEGSARSAPMAAQVAEPTAPELARVAAMQNKPFNPLRARWEARKDSSTVSTPALVDHHALYKLGYAKNKKRSREIIAFLHEAHVLKHDTMALSFFPHEALLSLSQELMAKSPLTDKEKYGIRVLIDGVQLNMHHIQQKFLDVELSQRPYALYYQGFTDTVYDSRKTMFMLQDTGVLDHNYKPINGGDNFETFKNYFVNSRIHRAQNDGDATQIFEWAHDYTEALRDVLFPLPGYESPKVTR